MARPISKNQLADFWLAEFLGEDKLCMLCGNHGIVDTRGHVKSPRGLPSGGRAWCICPNGRALKKGTGLAKPPEPMK